MASRFLQNKARESRARVDKAYGSSAYGGSSYTFEKPETETVKLNPLTSSLSFGSGPISQTKAAKLSSQKFNPLVMIPAKDTIKTGLAKAFPAAQKQARVTEQAAARNTAATAQPEAGSLVVQPLSKANELPRAGSREALALNRGPISQKKINELAEAGELPRAGAGVPAVKTIPKLRKYVESQPAEKALDSVAQQSDFLTVADSARGADISVPLFGGEAQRKAKYVLDDAYRARISTGAAMSAGSNPYQELDYMTDDEQDILRYYVGKGDYNKAGQYLDSLETTLNQRRREANRESIAKATAEHPALGAAANVAATYATPAAFLATGAQAIKNAVMGVNEPVDVNSRWFDAAHLAADTAQGVHQAAYDAAGGGAKGNAAAFAADTGLSVAQYLAKLPYGAVGALAYMGADAAGQTSTDVLERGGTTGQALGIGAAAGVIDALMGKLMEKLPINKLLKLDKTNAQGVRHTIQEVLKDSGVKAGENMVSQIANALVDTAAMGDKSEFRQLVNELMEQGYTQKQAEEKAFIWSFIYNTLLAGAEGAIPEVLPAQ